MRSTGLLNSPTRAAAARATRGQSPAFFLSQFRDVCGVVFPVPFVQEKEPINGPFAMLRVEENTREVLRLQRPPQTVPPPVHGIDQRPGTLHGVGFRIRHLGPRSFSFPLLAPF